MGRRRASIANEEEMKLKKEAEIERDQEIRRKLDEEANLIPLPTVDEVKEVLKKRFEGSLKKFKIVQSAIRGIKIELYNAKFEEMIELCNLFEKNNFDLIYGIAENLDNNSFFIIIRKLPANRSFYMKKMKKVVKGEEKTVYYNTLNKKYYNKKKKRIKIDEEI
jgi:hypothetical protein